MKTTIGDWIRSERDRLGLSQSDLAERLGLERDRHVVVWRWETGKNKPSYCTVITLCSVFRTLPPELVEAVGVSTG